MSEKTDNVVTARSFETCFFNTVSTMQKYLCNEPVAESAVPAARDVMRALTKHYQEGTCPSAEHRLIFERFDKAINDIPALAASGEVYAKLRLRIMFANAHKYVGEEHSLLVQFLQEMEKME